MDEVSAHPFADWESFYVIVGTSAAALTGLQFVVMALIAETDRPSSMRAVSAFGSPNVVHFCAALVISAILSAPWHRLSSAGLGLGIAGIAGVIYVLLVVRRARQQSEYEPVAEDWIFHALLPLLSYAALLVAALLLHRHTAETLFVIGAVSVGLVLIGIHNAWDTVTFIAVEQRQRDRNTEADERKRAPESARS